MSVLYQVPHGQAQPEDLPSEGFHVLMVVTCPSGPLAVRPSYSEKSGTLPVLEQAVGGKKDATKLLYSESPESTDSGEL